MGVTGAEAVLRLLSSMGLSASLHRRDLNGRLYGKRWANPELKDKPMYLSARHEEIAVVWPAAMPSPPESYRLLWSIRQGSLHASMALRGALHENVPMVVLTGESIAFGESPGPDLGAHWLSQLADIGGPLGWWERCVKWSFAVNTKAVFPSAIQRACQLAMTVPKGPVFISLRWSFCSTT